MWSALSVVDNPAFKNARITGVLETFFSFLNHKYFGQGQDVMSICLAMVCVLTALVVSLNNDLTDCKGDEWVD
jgi:hypothetical protein